MVTLNSIASNPGSRKVKHRVGRGTGSGSGSTSGYGNNGDKCRSGRKQKAYFEGGETPMSRRIGKFGFVHARAVTYQIVNLRDINKIQFSEKEIDVAWMRDKGLVHNASHAVKILGTGEFTKSVVIKAHAFSASAKEKIEKAKGKAEEISRV